MPEPSSFLWDIDISDSPDESRVNFEVGTKSSAVDKKVLKIADAFVSAANLGMFSMQPAASHITIAVEGTEYPSAGTIRFLWRVAGIQIGAYRVLLNMLSAAHRASGLLNWVRLTSAPVGGKRFSKNDLLNCPLPGKANKPPFELRVQRNLDDCREPLIRLEFERNISDDETAQLVPSFRAWDNLVLRGGYTENLEDRDPVLDTVEELEELEIPQTYMASPNTLEHLFYEFEGQAAAFDALMNLAIRLHYTFSPLAGLEID
jgi:hypothetical protein